MIKSIDKSTFFLYLWVCFYMYIILNDTYIPKGSPVTIIINAFVFLYSIYFVLSSCIHKYKFLYVFVFLAFLLTLIFFTSSNLYYSFKLWMKYSMGLICLPIGFGILSDKNLTTIWNVSKCFLILFLANYLLANLLHWGRHMYGNEIAWTEVGNLVDDGLQLNICVAALIPYYFKRISNRVVVSIIALLCIVITFVMMKRTPIACSIVCIFLYVAGQFYFNQKYGRIEHRSTGVFVVFIVSVLFMLMYVFSDLFISNYNNRFSKMDVGENQRTKEFVYIYDDIMNNKSDKIFFLGKETFNTVGTYHEGKWGRRMIHDNYGIILNGTGVIGFLYYILLNLYLLLVFFKYSKRVDFRNNDEARCFYIIYFSYWCMYMLTSMSGTIWLTLYPAFHFIVSGMILRYFYEFGEIPNMKNNQIVLL